MALQDLLLLVLAVAILANVLLLASIPLRSRSRDRAGQVPPIARAPSSEVSAPPPVRRSSRGEARDDGDARAVAAIEAFVADVSGDRAGLTPHPPSEAPPRRPAVVGAVSRTAADPTRAAPGRAVAHAPPPSAATLPMPRRHAPAWSLDGVADRAGWDRAVREESARVARFSRPVTVVIAELPRIDDVAARLGRDAADRVVAETARLLVAEGRSVDQIALLDYAVFGVLLPETEEPRAREYVDRVRAVADEWLQSAGLSVRLALGWASPAEDRDVEAAAALAQQRMREPEEPPVTGAPTA